jgi:asparagine synthase (glutamine-hydrolysing)
MCGIFGFIGKKYDESNNDLLRMYKSLQHRGPDSFGFYVKELIDHVSINFGHARLAIIDTTSTGHQPMHSKNNRYTIAFNGEIYNFQDLKAECERVAPSIKWDGQSDTEVILAGMELMNGLEFINRLVGMFAIALWDNLNEKFYLIRDRIGEKPLYYGYQGDQLLFASELKAFEVHSKFEKKVNQKAAVGFLLRSYVPYNLSIYENIFKVKPGTILEFDLNAIRNSLRPSELVYWSLKSAIENGRLNQYKEPYEVAKLELEKLLIDSVKKQSISDVPIGAFLSGGIDSSLVCALMRKYVTNDLMTFTIGMPPPGVNEAIHAEKVANHIGSNHDSKYLNTREIIQRIEDIVSYWDEPFADSSQIPTFFVAEHAKKFVTVVLSGDGADEFLFGYPDHKVYQRYKKFKPLALLKIDKICLRILKLIGQSDSKLCQKIESLSYLLNLMIRFSNLGLVHSNWHNKFWNRTIPVKKSLHGGINFFLFNEEETFSNVGHYDALAYLPNDILVKVDRAAMAVSLESRAPFLDHRILEFLVRLPEDYLIKEGVAKRITKDILYKYVPKEIIDRPKQGFSIPITYWLRNDLKEWAQSILDGISNNSEFWDKTAIMNLWKEHLGGKIDHTEKIWNIIVLELFFKNKMLLHHQNKVGNESIIDS